MNQAGQHTYHWMETRLAIALSGVRKQLASVYKFSPRYCTCLRPVWRKLLYALLFLEEVREGTYSSLLYVIICPSHSVRTKASKNLKLHTKLHISVFQQYVRDYPNPKQVLTKLWNALKILNQVFLLFPASVQWLRPCRCHRSPGPEWPRLDWSRSFWRSGSWGPCRPSPPSGP